MSEEMAELGIELVPETGVDNRGQKRYDVCERKPGRDPGRLATLCLPT